MAITNATTASFTGLSALSNGAQKAMLKRLKAFKLSPLLHLVDVQIIKDGQTTGQTASMDQFGHGSGATFSENGTLTATANPAIEAVVYTPAQRGIAIAVTSQAMRQIDPEQREVYRAMKRAMAIEALVDFVAYGASTGLAARAASMATNTDRTGVEMTWDPITTEMRKIRGRHGGDLKGAFIGSPRQVAGIRDDLRAQNASGWSHPACPPELIEALFKNGAMPDNLSFTGIYYDQIAVFQTNLTDQLYENSGDVWGILMIGKNADAQGLEEEIQPPLVLFGTENPCLERPTAKPVYQIRDNGLKVWAYSVTEANVENASQEYFLIEFATGLAHATNTSNPCVAIRSIADE